MGIKRVKEGRAGGGWRSREADSRHVTRQARLTSGKPSGRTRPYPWKRETGWRRASSELRRAAEAPAPHVDSPQTCFPSPTSDLAPFQPRTDSECVFCFLPEIDGACRRVCYTSSKCAFKEAIFQNVTEPEPLGKISTYSLEDLDAL